ncbi:response regulator [candidate division TA06 bacterium]|uniref:Response regulator n=1 Tax=candidate division TA06 bacterium TaxID=2250710 RepID=A0A933IAX1_UNCT6|nr:response regulator [candidate division TA06 bacterium]
MPKILIIDDEEDIRLLYRKELESNGYQAVAASTEDQAKEMFRLGGIDLVILDIKMTTNDGGIDLLRWIRETESVMPIILNSAYPHYKADFGTWLANEYLVKSGDLKELTATVAKLLKQKGLP